MPGAHALQPFEEARAADVEKVPAGHALQAAEEVAAVADEYVPTWQAVQADAAGMVA